MYCGTTYHTHTTCTSVHVSRIAQHHNHSKFYFDTNVNTLSLIALDTCAVRTARIISSPITRYNCLINLCVANLKSPLLERVSIALNAVGNAYRTNKRGLLADTDANMSQIRSNNAALIRGEELAAMAMTG